MMLTDFSHSLERDLNNARLRGLAYYLRTAVLVLQNNMKKTERQPGMGGVIIQTTLASLL